MIAAKLNPNQVVPLEAGPIWSFVDGRRGIGKTFAGAYAMAQRMEIGLDVDLIGFRKSYVMDQMAYELWKVIGGLRATRSWVDNKVGTISFEGVRGVARLWTPRMRDWYLPPRIIGGAWFDEALIEGRPCDISDMMTAATRHGRTPHSRVVWTGAQVYPGFANA